MSTSESKKSSSPKHAKKSHRDKKNEESEQKDNEKNIDDIPVEEVHTVNNWENADLGDDQRKKKFLRLMGAKKRKEDDRMPDNESHEDAPSTEKKHCRTKAETEIINRELEKQFNESLQSKIAHTYHGGLGFHGNESASSSDDWHQQQAKLNFVPAASKTGSSLDHVVITETKSDEDKASKKEEKTKKSKS